MSFLSGLYTLIFSPLELLFEVVFTIANRLIGNAGLSIIFLSLAINFLVLPLYKRADELQAEEREIQVKMAPHIKHIKKMFKGDERFFMLQEYYYLNHYKPVYALKSSVSLLLQVPFFVAAYNLLSGMQSLQGMKFGFISDLGQQDALFTIGSFPINVLPILMTVINIVSGIIYTKGHPVKEKIQVYGLAAVFLVLLYNSPSGLVFYWLLNNVFSLVKNIFYKLKNPKKVLSVISALAGVVVLVLTARTPSTVLLLRQKLLLACLSFLLILPLILPVINRRLKLDRFFAPAKKDAGVFFAGALLMTLITGLMIPGSVINSSPEEFVNALDPANPSKYLISSMLLAFGSFVLWGGVFYFFMSEKMKSLFSHGIWVICGVSVLNYLGFARGLGMLTSYLQYETFPAFRVRDYFINAFIVLVVGAALYFIYKKFQKFAKMILLAGAVAIAAVGIRYVANITRIYKEAFENNSSYSLTAESEPMSIPLSKNGQNVVVLMMDRAVGNLLPYIFDEKPELKEQFDGFTYYPNTISYGPCTNIGVPAIYGGYEYTPENMNSKPGIPLVDKHNEALRVMPVLFGDNGYNVTVFDPPYANYKWTSDLSIYDDHPEFHCFTSIGSFNYYEDDDIGKDWGYITSREEEIRNRDFFCFGLMKVAPVILQETIYDNGMYNEATNVSVISQRVEPNLKECSGYDLSFLNSYIVLKNLSDMTTIDDSNENNFFIMSNGTPHNPCILQEPDYVPALHVDNTAYDVDMESRYTLNGVTMPMTTDMQVAHYHINMASYLKLGEWFDYLKEMGVYDNTRIIIVSDHGRGLDQGDYYCNGFDMQDYMPILLVKDFDAKGFNIDESFMTNGDTPAIATSGLIDDPKNPFTGHPLDYSGKEGPQKIFYTYIWNPASNNGNTFLPGSWFEFNGTDPCDMDNWTYLGDY